MIIAFLINAICPNSNNALKPYAGEVTATFTILGNAIVLVNVTKQIQLNGILIYGIWLLYLLQAFFFLYGNETLNTDDLIKHALPWTNISAVLLGLCYFLFKFLAKYICPEQYFSLCCSTVKH